MKQQSAYGLWPSPLTPAAMCTGLRFGGLAWDTDGERLMWLESSDGQGVLRVGDDSANAPRSLGGDLSVRASGVLYGGGDFTVSRGVAYFVADGRLHRQPLVPVAPEDARPRPITPAFGAWAAPTVSPDGHWIVVVHSYEDEDTLSIVDVEGARRPQVLASGSDFYMQPRWHPTGTRMAWISWDHPRMPFQGSRLEMADVVVDGEGCPRLGESTVIAGSERVSVSQPEFSPDGRYLTYLSDESGWGSLYLRDLETGETRLLVGEEAEISEPTWVQDVRTYAWAADGQAIYYCRHSRGYAHLWAVHVASGRRMAVPGLEEYSHISQVVASPGGQVAFLATGTATPQRVVSLRPRRGPERVRARSDRETLPPALISTPRPIRWQAPDGEDVHGLFYPPQGSGQGAEGELPPLLVRVHGGPTSQRFAEYSTPVLFFTTRGVAVLEVNYRGSTGYGRAYADRLNGAWGIVDADDAVSGARHVAAQGWADAGRMAIMGGSAGGYTVLQSLIRYPGVFAAGLCLYGVVDLFGLAADTHKFERHYTDSLVGPLPEAAALYRERSPVYHAEEIRDPVAVFQGEDDPVVPKEQAEAIVAALRRCGVPHEYHLYPGEGHGWRRAATIAQFYETALAFVTRHVLYA